MFRKYSRQSGFTIIELMLSMAFVAFILLFVTLTLVQILRTYNKGVTMKEVSQAGRTITDDISRAMKAQVAGTIKTANVSQGVLCVGNTMYYWKPLYNGPISAPTPTTGAGVDTGIIGNSMMIRRAHNQNAACTPPAPPITQGTDTYPLLSGQSRVIWADVIASNSHLVKLRFIIGTYAATENSAIDNRQYNNIYTTPYFDATNKITCRPGNSGDFCSFAEFTTVVYLPNGAE